MAPLPVVLTARMDAIGVLRLNRPEVLNAIDEDVLAELPRQLEALVLDPAVRVIVITGEGRGFSTGADIRSLHGRGPDGRREFMLQSHAMMRRIETAPKPVIAAVNGVAAGGGFELMLACDFAVAVESARIGLTEIRYGFLPGGGGTQRLPRWVPLPVAKRLILGGELLTAAEARDIGVVLKVVKEGALMNEVEALARGFTERSGAALAEAKALVNGALEWSLEEGLAAEREANVRLLSSPEAMAGIEAFLKRGSGR